MILSWWHAAPSLRILVEQRRIAAYEAGRRLRRLRWKALTGQKARWVTPEYIRRSPTRAARPRVPR
jgi:SLT domain-containing protein